MFWIQKESSKNLEVDGIEVLNQDGIVNNFLVDLYQMCGALLKWFHIKVLNPDGIVKEFWWTWS